MIAVAHSHAVPAEVLGFEIDEGAICRVAQALHELGIADQVDDVVSGDPSSSVLPTIPEERPAEPPAAPDGDELPPSERVRIAPTDGSVVVEGVGIGEDCTLKVIRTACETLGLSTRGSKRECMSRLQKFIQHQELRTLGIRVVPEPTAIGSHQPNGGAERAVEPIRSHANILVTHLESCCKATKQIFSCFHPVYGWALVHSAWVSCLSRSDCLLACNRSILLGPLCNMEKESWPFPAGEES